MASDPNIPDKPNSQNSNSQYQIYSFQEPTEEKNSFYDLFFKILYDHKFVSSGKIKNTELLEYGKSNSLSMTLFNNHRPFEYKTTLKLVKEESSAETNIFLEEFNTEDMLVLLKRGGVAFIIFLVIGWFLSLINASGFSFLVLLVLLAWFGMGVYGQLNTRRQYFSSTMKNLCEEALAVHKKQVNFNFHFIEKPCPYGNHLFKTQLKKNQKYQGVIKCNFCGNQVLVEYEENNNGIFMDNLRFVPITKLNITPQILEKFNQFIISLSRTSVSNTFSLKEILSSWVYETSINTNYEDITSLLMRLDDFNPLLKIKIDRRGTEEKSDDMILIDNLQDKNDNKDISIGSEFQEHTLDNLRNALNKEQLTSSREIENLPEGSNNFENINEDSVSKSKLDTESDLTSIDDKDQSLAKLRNELNSKSFNNFKNG